MPFQIEPSATHDRGSDSSASESSRCRAHKHRVVMFPGARHSPELPSPAMSIQRWPAVPRVALQSAGSAYCADQRSFWENAKVIHLTELQQLGIPPSTTQRNARSLRRTAGRNGTNNMRASEFQPRQQWVRARSAAWGTALRRHSRPRMLSSAHERDHFPSGDSAGVRVRPGGGQAVRRRAVTRGAHASKIASRRNDRFRAEAGDAGNRVSHLEY